MSVKKYKMLFLIENFEEMNWHDCSVYGISFLKKKNELLFDIDYLLEWIETENDEYYKFLVAPGTLVFKNIFDIKVDLEFDGSLEMENIIRTDKARCKNIDNTDEWSWELQFQQGIISFRSIGYELFLKETPILSSSPELGREYGSNFLKKVK